MQSQIIALYLQVIAMSLLRRIKSLFGIQSYSQKYARENGFRLAEVNGVGWNLYKSDELVCQFPHEFAASQYIYQLNMEALYNLKNKN